MAVATAARYKKRRGYGREMGHHALEFYTQVKSVWARLE